MLHVSRRKALLGLLAIGTGAAVAAAPKARASGLGRADVLKSLPLVRQDGSTFTVADLRGRVALCVLWKAACPSCIAELPQLGRLAQAMGPAGLDLVLISRPHAFANDHAVAASYGLGAQAASIDPNLPHDVVVAALGLQDGVFDMPQSFAFVRPDLRVVHSALGPTDWADPDVVRRLRRAA